MTNLELWAWGANNYGQLAKGQPCEQVERPLKLQKADLDACSKIITGGGHTLLLTAGSLYAAGWNNKGQCGLKTFQDASEFMRVDTPAEFVHVAAGWDFSIGLDRHGCVYGCGSNAFGQLCLSKDVKFLDEFKLIEGLSNIKAVSCGMRHSLFMCNNGNIFVCGNGKKGQLCTETPLKENTFCAFEAVSYTHLTLPTTPYV